MTEDRNLCTIFNDMCTTDIPFYWSCESVRLPWIAPTLTELVPRDSRWPPMHGSFRVETVPKETT